MLEHLSSKALSPLRSFEVNVCQKCAPAVEFEIEPEHHDHVSDCVIIVIDQPCTPKGTIIEQDSEICANLLSVERNVVELIIALNETFQRTGISLSCRSECDCFSAILHPAKRDGHIAPSFLTSARISLAVVRPPWLWLTLAKRTIPLPSSTKVEG